MIESNRISIFLILVFVICFVFYGYCILVFAFLRRVIDIQIFVRIEKGNKSNQNLWKFCLVLHTCVH